MNIKVYIFFPPPLLNLSLSLPVSFFLVSNSFLSLSRVVRCLFPSLSFPPTCSFYPTLSVLPVDPFCVLPLIAEPCLLPFGSFLFLKRIVRSSYCARIASMYVLLSLFLICFSCKLHRTPSPAFVTLLFLILSLFFRYLFVAFFTAIFSILVCATGRPSSIILCTVRTLCTCIYFMPSVRLTDSTCFSFLPTLFLHLHPSIYSLFPVTKLLCLSLFCWLWPITSFYCPVSFLDDCIRLLSSFSRIIVVSMIIECSTEPFSILSISLISLLRMQLMSRHSCISSPFKFSPSFVPFRLIPLYFYYLLQSQFFLYLILMFPDSCWHILYLVLD